MSKRPNSSHGTGDLQNNVEKLRQELLHCKYSGPIDLRTLKKGSPGDLLPLVHFALLGYSKWVHDALIAAGYELFAKTDIRFLETVYKLLRSEFDYQPQVSRQ
jgi:centrosomal protein CEP44